MMRRCPPSGRLRRGPTVALGGAGLVVSLTHVAAESVGHAGVQADTQSRPVSRRVDGTVVVVVCEQVPMGADQLG